MRSVMEVFGNISMATKDVQVYSADKLDWGTIDARFLRARGHYGTGLLHRTNIGEDGAVVFVANTDLNAADSFIPIIQDSADDSTYNDCLNGQDTAVTFGAGAMLKGVAVAIPLPRQHRRYMRASCMPKSSGTLTATVIHAFIEYGPNDN
jgi:hypothetical protein